MTGKESSMEVQKILLESIQKPNKEQTGQLRVAAYCRVSTDTEDQKTSFEGQVKYYSELINTNPEWEFAGIFADEGITGTSAARRPQFQTLIRICEEGKIDLILTKSISRFARNTLECLTFVRHLNKAGVHIIFESNNIDTRMAFSEMLLTVLAAFAQEESRSISENTSWGIRKRFEEGVTRWCRLYGYEKNKDGEYQIVPEQAAVVQKIYDLYEHGESIQKIRKYLEANSIKSPTGKPKWTNSAIHTLLINERYTGDILLQKYITESHLTHKSVKNDSTKIPSFYIENHHAPIVSKKQYKRCMKIMGMRRVTGQKKEYDTGTCNQYPLGDKLHCPYCNSTLYQRNIPVQARNGSGWSCEKGEKACHGFIIRSNLVETALLEAYRLLNPDNITEQTKTPNYKATAITTSYNTAAHHTLKIKKQYPLFKSVEFWWVDDLINHIEFGPHKTFPQEKPQTPDLEKNNIDDRTMTVFWKCGIITTVMSGANTDQEHPPYIAELYNNYLKRQRKKERETT